MQSRWRQTRKSETARLFFLVSGENPTLPFAEIKAILEAEGYEYEVLSKLAQVLILKSDQRCIGSVARRASLTRACGRLIAHCKASAREILNVIKNTQISSYISPNESFCVRIKRVRGSSPELDRLALERKIGKVILRSAEKVRVDLKRPKKTFLGVLSDGKFVFGLKEAEIRGGDFKRRGLPKTIYSHSAAMPPKLARCMINLARAKAGDIILDPFCGTGSLLVEANLIGCRVVGLDVKHRMIEGSTVNLSAYNVVAEGLIVADARKPPISPDRIDRVVTDPPYGISTTTLGMKTSDLFKKFLMAIRDPLKDDGYICLAAPKSINVNRIAEELDFKHEESHFIYVHRRLTREIAVFKMP
ncbi:hypothetical protein DRO37_01980 [Candidatus Bathyarchaeota archaeon]|nr:MAG: hypothetical protein DRO37_01980 [Candidatus Bathyarchaeota archaeon]